MQKEFYHVEGARYVVIGKLVNGKRFRDVYSNPRHALGINLYNGRIWQVVDGKRKLVKEVFN
jgi:hypothetical protein